MVSNNDFTFWFIVENNRDLMMSHLIRFTWYIPEDLNAGGWDAVMLKCEMSFFEQHFIMPVDFLRRKNAGIRVFKKPHPQVLF